MILSGVVEADEVYQTAGLKGKFKRAGKGRRRGKRKPGRGTYESDKLPVISLVERGSGVVLYFAVPNMKLGQVVRVVRNHVASGSVLVTDEFSVYNSLSGYVHCSVNHSERFADGLVHVNSCESANFDFRQFLRKFRGVSKDYLDSYAASASVFALCQAMSPELALNLLLTWIFTTNN